MAEQRIHYLALSGIEKRIADLRVDREKASVQLQEALAMGDLRENSEYDAAKDEMARIVKELDALAPALSMQPIRANPNARVIEEGCVIHLRVFSVTPSPMTHAAILAENGGKEPQSIFDGLLMYGGAAPGQNLMSDHALSTDTPIGKAILGKQPGFHTVRAPAGHSNFIVEKVTKDPETGEEITPETLKRYPVFVM